MEREVAQAGSALGLGPRGRRSESCLPDKKVSSKTLTFFMPLYQQAMPKQRDGHPFKRSELIKNSLSQ